MAIYLVSNSISYVGYNNGYWWKFKLGNSENDPWDFALKAQNGYWQTLCSKTGSSLDSSSIWLNSNKRRGTIVIPAYGTQEVYINLSNSTLYTITIWEGKNTQQTATLGQTGTWSGGQIAGTFKLDYSSWEEESTVNYTVAYARNGGTGTMANQTVSGISGSVTFIPKDNEFTLPSGKYFDSWNTESDGSGDTYYPGSSYSISKSLILYAIWKDYTYYTVTFNKNATDATAGTTSWRSSGLKEGESATLYLSNITNPTRGEAYSFEGWSTSSGSNNSVNVVSPVTITRNITFYAVWKTKNAFTITFKAPDVNYEESKTFYTTNSSYSFNMETLRSQYFTTPSSREGYTLLGWSLSSNGTSGNLVTGNVSISSDKTFYAVWELKSAVAPKITSTSTGTNSIEVNWTINANYGSTIAHLFKGETIEESAKVGASTGSSCTSSSTTYSHTFSTNITSNTTYTIRVQHINDDEVASTTKVVLTNLSSFYWTSNDSENIVAGQPISNITYTKWNSLQNIINAIITRESLELNQTYTEVAQDDIIYADTDDGAGKHQGFNNIRTKIKNLGTDVTSCPIAVKDQPATAAHFTNLRDALNRAISNTNSKH